MSELNRFERRLAAGLEAYAGPRQSVDADAIARTAANRLPLRRSVLLRFTTGVAPEWRLAWRPIAVVVLVAVLTLALAANAVFVGSQRRALPALIRPAGNGLIAYASGGDIYVGDPATGETTAIVSGPEIDSGPIFSPAGTRIAFIRGNPSTEEASLVVVRVDGTDERVVMPPGYSQRGTTFTWTPDGGSLAVYHDSAPFTTPYFDGELSLIDASGVAEPRLLTPPLPIVPDGGFGHTDQVAPMFRPPNGDAILSAGNDPTVADPASFRGAFEQLVLWDADLESHVRLHPEGLDGRYSFAAYGMSWSPDGSRIEFGFFEFDRSGAYLRGGAFVMNADGTGVRPSPGGVWSPDGTKMASQRGCPDPDRQGAVVVITDMASGAERVLEATAVETKYEGDVSRLPPGESSGCFGGWIQGPTGRAWDYEGWSWSPDGQSIVMLERRGTRPKVVDVDSGRATYLPWEADSPPSWRRISP